MKKIPVILDGDPGHDDAIAWVLAKGSQEMDILGVTSVCGNQTIEKTTYNARRICTLIGLDAPMAMGRLRPLISEPIIAPTVHGESGLDGPALPEPAYPLLEMDAVTLMAKLLEESPEPVTLIPTGPLTNVAALLLAYPELKSKIARISLMGGGVQYGNWTPAAEFNILVDPEAADVVFSSGIPIIMAGLDVTEKAMIFPEDFERIRALGNPVAVIVAVPAALTAKFLPITSITLASLEVMTKLPLLISALAFMAGSDVNSIVRFSCPTRHSAINSSLFAITNDLAGSGSSVVVVVTGGSVVVVVVVSPPPVVELEVVGLQATKPRTANNAIGNNLFFIISSYYYNQFNNQAKLE